MVQDGLQFVYVSYCFCLQYKTLYGIMCNVQDFVLRRFLDIM